MTWVCAPCGEINNGSTCKVCGRRPHPQTKVVTPDPPQDVYTETAKQIEGLL